MSGFLGGTKTVDNRTEEARNLSQGLGDYIAKGGFKGLNLGEPDLQPIKDLFTQQTAQAYAHAKEGSGNLTGTGYGARIGRALGETSTQQGAVLADILQRSREANSNRLMNVLMPFIGAGVAPSQTVYQPGFLDYALQGGAAVAGAAGSAGGFGKLFGGGTPAAPAKA